MKKKGLIVMAAAVGMVALVLYISGVFSSGKIQPGPAQPPSQPDFRPSLTALVQTIVIPEIYEAVGTLRPRTQTQIEAQVTGKVLEVRVRSGEAINRGDTLVVLDDREYATRLERAHQGLQSAKSASEEAKQVVNGARAAFVKAELQFQRIEKLFRDKAISSSELDQAKAEYLLAQAKLQQGRDGAKGAEAAVRQAQKLVEEVQITKNYTVIKAPERAEVVKRLIEPGDLALPGKPLLIVQTAGSLRLEAYVREGLIGQVRPNKELKVVIDALEKTVTGVVEEVVPSADPKTRTFLVKVGLPEVMGAYSGMFARLLVPSGHRQAIVIPAEAVRRVGQLETVMVKQGQAWQTFYVKTGQAHGNFVEVLSGLQGTETVALFGKENV